MGKLLDMLERASGGVRQSMGFSAKTRGEKIPPMLLLGCVELNDRTGAKRIVDAGLDGALICSLSDGSMIKPSNMGRTLKGVAWGSWGSLGSSHRSNGADFEVFSSDETLLSALGSEENTTIMEVSPELDDGLLRTIEDVPVDAFLVSIADAPSLSVRQLMRISRVRSVISKYLLVHLPTLPAVGELAHLRDVGVDALVVDASTYPLKALKACYMELQSLPHAAPQRRKDRPAPLVPMMNPSSGPARQEDDDDDELD